MSVSDVLASMLLEWLLMLDVGRWSLVLRNSAEPDVEHSERKSNLALRERLTTHTHTPHRSARRGEGYL